jgi:hypothetical protein
VATIQAPAANIDSATAFDVVWKIQNLTWRPAWETDSSASTGPNVQKSHQCMTTPMDVVVFGTYDLGKPRTRILLAALREYGAKVIECHEDVWASETST